MDGWMDRFKIGEERKPGRGGKKEMEGLVGWVGT